MALTYGGWSGHMKVGIDVTISGLTATVKYYAGIDGWDFSDTQLLTYTGAITGSTSFTNSLSAGSHGTHQGSITDSMLVATKTRSVSPGTSYTFAVSLSGAYEGSAPSHSVTFNVPVLFPSAPGTPTLSAITTGGMTVAWSAPGDWGGNATNNYQLQRADNAAFTGATTITVNGATSYAATGLNPATTYYWRAAAVNAAGVGPYSGTGSATTLASTAGPPRSLAVSNIGPASARATWVVPLDTGGSPITSYELQHSTDAAFTVATLISNIMGLTYDITGLTPKTPYYLRVRARNANGVGDWSTTVTFTTLAGAKVMFGGSIIDVPTFVKVGGVMTPVAPQKRVAGAWVY